jgi:dsDNA-binding SOS-regulon protein
MSFLFETAPNLSDEVRLRILEQAPEILNTANAVLSDYQETAKKALENNRESVQNILANNHEVVGVMLKSYHEAAERLSKLLSDPNASFEEKQYWNGELSKWLREMRECEKDNKKFLSEIDRENKAFFENLLKYVGIAAIVIVGGAIAVLTGGKLSND